MTIADLIPALQQLPPETEIEQILFNCGLLKVPYVDDVEFSVFPHNENDTCYLDLTNPADIERLKEILR